MLHCELTGLSTAEAFAELAQTTWPDCREDLAFGRARHTPTIRRMAKPGLLGLDERHARTAAWRDARDADRARWVALPETVRAAISAACDNARGRDTNVAARYLAARHGITVHAASIDNLRSLIDPRQPWNV
ncbi:MAG: hypothetical protein ACRET2_07620 [Steroidobacteraceae bacterium]